MQLWNMQDDILIRFADILLMAAELGGPNAASYFNRVHERAGLDPIGSPTLDDIKLERRLELAFEGLRYFDLLRWGVTEAETAIEAANGLTVQFIGEPGEYETDFRVETGGFLPIPQTEITLSEGILEQTPGWEEFVN
jgi:starch-binding outer membrane protein, SusD/RagB family